MDATRFDAMTRTLADRLNRRRLLGAATGLAAGLVGVRAGEAACPEGQVQAAGRRCLCRTTGRPPVGGVCPCGLGEVPCQDKCYREVPVPGGPAGQQLAWIYDVLRTNSSASLTEADLVGRVIPGGEATILAGLQYYDAWDWKQVAVLTATDTVVEMLDVLDGYSPCRTYIEVESTPPHRIVFFTSVCETTCPSL